LSAHIEPINSVFSISTPFSNLFPASVSIFNFLFVCDIDCEEKFADSKKTFFVSSLTSVSFPPITPAIAIGDFISHINNIPSSNSLSFPSRVTIFSLASASLTTIFVSILSKSKACKGWPYSYIKTLVQSTILLTGLNPTDNNFLKLYIEEFLTFTFFIIIPTYLGHNSIFFISISKLLSLKSLFLFKK